MNDTQIQPTALTLHERSRILEIAFADGASFRLPFEFLRVHSPSAEVQGHSPEEATLPFGKREVTITSLRPCGHYAVQPVFSDGHETGLFSWAYLRRLGQEQEKLWNAYLEKLQAAGLSREAA